MPTHIGKYEILEEIARGGFAVVYKARDPFIKRLVALKACSAQDEQMLQRFFREAEIAGNLHHRNVTIVHDFGVEGEEAYLVQEYLSGEDLVQKIRRGEILSLAEKANILQQVALGLSYAHSKGVIHRDIKPSNIRILESGQVKIMDFGIAKLTTSSTQLTQQGVTVGTLAYLSPEQVRNLDITERTDIFCFGVVAYELLTYEHPFKGKTISQLLPKILDERPRPIRELSPECPPALEALVSRCLEKNPEDRFPSFKRILAVLKPISSQLHAQEKEARRGPGKRPAPAPAVAPHPAVPPGAPPPPGIENAPTRALSLGAEPAAARPPAAAPSEQGAEEPAETPDASSPGMDDTQPVVLGLPDQPPPPTEPRPAPGPTVVQRVPPAPTPPPPIAARRDEEVLAPLRPPPDAAETSGEAAVAPIPGGPRKRRWVLIAIVAATSVLAVLLTAVLWQLFAGRPREEGPVAETPPPVEEAAPVVVEPGLLRIVSEPWSEVVSVIDEQGQRHTVGPNHFTPLALELPPGLYTVTLSRPGVDEQQTCEVRLASSEVQTCRVELEPVDVTTYFKEAGWWR